MNKPQVLYSFFSFIKLIYHSIINKNKKAKYNSLKQIKKQYISSSQTNKKYPILIPSAQNSSTIPHNHIAFKQKRMQTLIQQNRRLHQIMQKCEQQIIQLKKIGQDHEQQIDNLLKFNQRLLSIIENEMPNKVLSRTSSGSNLHPIDETNEKEHQAINIPQRFANGVGIRERVEHLQVQQVQRLSQEDEEQEEQYKKHVNLPVNSSGQAKTQSDGFNINRFRNADSYQNRNQRPQLSSGRNSTEHYPENVIYREEKQSLIDIPKFFKLEKGLNEHYQKELFQSVEQLRPPLRNSNNSNQSSPMSQFPLAPNSSNPSNNTLTRFPSQSRKQSIPSQSSQMNKISQAITERLMINQQQLKQEYSSIRQLIAQYKQDFDTQQYTHLCTIIKNDLENDLKELAAANNDSLKFYMAKEKELNRLKASISQFSPVQRLVEIIRKLKVGEQTERIILNKVAPNHNVSNNGLKVNGSTNLNGRR